MENKKGISPLIATVLIIGFTIVAAILVITWINTLVGDKTDAEACRSEALDACISTSGVFEFSTSGVAGTDLVATVSNGGGTASNFTVLFMNESGILYNEEIGMDAYGSASTAVYTTGFSGDRKARFIQVVRTTYKNTECETTCGEGTYINI